MRTDMEKRHRFRRGDATTKAKSKRFGTFIRSARQRAGLDVATVARATGLTADYIYKLERGYSPVPATERILQLATVLGIEADKILTITNRLEPEIFEAVRDKQVAVCTFIRLTRFLPPSALEYIIERMNDIIAELEPATAMADTVGYRD